jgi:hypothetical protein
MTANTLTPEELLEREEVRLAEALLWAEYIAWRIRVMHKGLWGSSFVCYDVFDCLRGTPAYCELLGGLEQKHLGERHSMQLIFDNDPPEFTVAREAEYAHFHPEEVNP